MAEHPRKPRRCAVFQVEHSKTKKAFLIPLPAQVVGWFAELQAMAFGSRYVLPIRCRKNGNEADAHMEPVTLNAALDGLAKTLGDKCRRFTPHDLRSTCRSHLGMLGVDVLIAERLAGEAADAMAKIPRESKPAARPRRAAGKTKTTPIRLHSVT